MKNSIMSFAKFQPMSIFFNSEVEEIKLRKKR